MGVRSVFKICSTAAILVELAFFAAFSGSFLSCRDQKSDQKPEPTQSVVLDTVGVVPPTIQKSGDAYLLPWPVLMKTKFENRFEQKLGIEVTYPLFNDTLRALAGKRVIVEGYYIPVDETGDASIVILSAYPYANCFFCGNAGVETIIDVLGTKDLPPLKLDSRIKFEGTLRLNAENYDYLIYVLDDARLVPN